MRWFVIATLGFYLILLEPSGAATRDRTGDYSLQAGLNGSNRTGPYSLRRERRAPQRASGHDRLWTLLGKKREKRAPKPPQAIKGGQSAFYQHLELLAWHVGIYSKQYQPFMQICGGTIVSLKAVISAAHCFWSDVGGPQPASQFAVAAGHVFRPWADPENNFSQKSDVLALHIPVRYRGSAANFQEDIAVVLLSQEFLVGRVVRPACVSFDEGLDTSHTSSGTLGMVFGWGLTEADGQPAKRLNFLQMPAVDIQECVERSDPAFVKYLTGDKLCAGVTTGKSLCRGDSGGGWVVIDDGTPYLRGVASTAPRDGHECNTHALAALTHVASHRAFLLRHLPQLEEECAKYYQLVGQLVDKSGIGTKCEL